VVFRLRRFSAHWARLAWVSWGVAVCAAFVVGWSRANGRVWFPILIGVTLGITVLAWRRWTGPWTTLTLAADGSSITLHSLSSREVLPLPPPVELCLYEQTGSLPVEGGDVQTVERTDLFVTSGGRSIVVSGRADRVRHLAADAAEVLETGPPTVAEVYAPVDGHRRDDPDTRWVNGSIRVGWPWHYLSTGWGIASVPALALGAVLTVTSPQPEDPELASPEEVRQELTGITDGLSDHLGVPADLPQGLSSIETGDTSRRCERDHQWFWGPPPASRYKAVAHLELPTIDIDGLDRSLRGIVSLPPGSGGFPMRYDLHIGPVPRTVWTDIDVEADRISVAMETGCVHHHDGPDTVPMLRRHAQQALTAVTARARPLED